MKLPSAKNNWKEAIERYEAWWQGKGLILAMWGCPPARGNRFVTAHPVPEDPKVRWGDPVVRAALAEEWLAQGVFPGDILPVCDTDLGPGNLAAMLGSPVGWGKDTIWFEPAPGYGEDEEGPVAHFDPAHPEVRRQEAIFETCIRTLGDRFWVACPDLVEGLDVLASLRGGEALMIDLLERPEWAQRKLGQIAEAWEAAYRHFEPHFTREGCICFGAFRAFGRGRVAKVQCDASAMISPELFGEFVAPFLQRQCDWLDHSLYHLDGTQCIAHLDLLLAEVPALDAIEWTPQAGIEPGGHPRWYDLYRRIKAGGKAVQVLCEPAEVVPLLDAIGSEGVCVLASFRSLAEYEATAVAVRKKFGSGILDR